MENKEMKKIFKQAIFIFSLVLLLPVLMGASAQRRVTVIVDGKTHELRTNETNPKQILQSIGVTLEQGDRVRLRGLIQRVQDGSSLEVKRAVPFTVTRSEQTENYRSTKRTVGEALRELGIYYSKNRIYPNPQTELTKDLQIFILERGESLHLREAELNFSTQYREDRSILFGTERVASEGKPGKATIISKRKKNKDGTHTDEELTRRVTTEPKDKIIHRGMGMSVKTPEGYKRYTKKLIMEATAYVATGNKTSVGLVPYVGIVAVDPRVIPYYTKMYIPEYGLAMAGDTGGDIVGNRIDLFYDSYQGAIEWGRRNVTVYILAE